MNLGKCPDCGNLCSVNAVSCPKCGRVLQAGDVITARPLSAKSDSFFKVIAVIAGLIASAIAFAVSMFGVDLLRSVFPGLADGESLGWFFVASLTVFIIFFISYLLLSLLFGFLRHGIGWKWGLWLMSLPVAFGLLLLIFSLFSFTSSGILIIWVAVLFMLAGGLAGGCLGAYITGLIKNKLVH